MTARRMTLEEIYAEADRMKHRAIMDGHTSISLMEFKDYVFLPLMLLCQDERKRQFEDIRENGT